MLCFTELRLPRSGGPAISLLVQDACEPGPAADVLSVISWTLPQCLTSLTIGALAIIALRVAAIGNVSALVDVVVMTTYVSCFAFRRFVYTLYIFGHHLRPDAPVKVIVAAEAA